MDISSTEAQYLAILFTRGRMRPTENRAVNPPIQNGFVNDQDHQIFSWTNQDRIVRIDAPNNALNAIAPHRQHFDSILNFNEGEHLIHTRAMARNDLLPMPGLVRQISSALMPQIGAMVGFAVISSVTGFGMGIFALPALRGVQRFFHLRRHNDAVQVLADSMPVPHGHAQAHTHAHAHAHAHARPAHASHVGYLQHRFDDMGETLGGDPFWDYRDVSADQPSFAEMWRQASNSERVMIMGELGFAGHVVGTVIRGAINPDDAVSQPRPDDQDPDRS